MKRVLFFLLLLLNFNAFAKDNLIVKGYFKNFQDDTFVSIKQYNYEDVTIATETIKSGECIFNNLPELQEGVYQIVVNYPSQKTNRKSIYFLNLIIDKSETLIEFIFNPKESLLPTFIKSNINKNWSDFLRLQSFDEATISHLKLVMQNKTKSELGSSTSFENILKNEIDKMLQNRNEFLINNYNKWSNYMVKYAIVYSNIKEVTKDEYWLQFDSNNAELLNTPIYHEAIQNYIVKFYANATEDQYKKAFEEVIKTFSKNDITREWIVKYVITGLYRIENNNLSNYFSKKYNYKI